MLRYRMMIVYCERERERNVTEDWMEWVYGEKRKQVRWSKEDWTELDWSITYQRDLIGVNGRNIFDFELISGSCPLLARISTCSCISSDQEPVPVKSTELEAESSFLIRRNSSRLPPFTSSRVYSTPPVWSALLSGPAHGTFPRGSTNPLLAFRGYRWLHFQLSNPIL